MARSGTAHSGRFGDFDGLKAVELGSGRGLNAVLYASRGAGDAGRQLAPRARSGAELFASFGRRPAGDRGRCLLAAGRARGRLRGRDVVRPLRALPRARRLAAIKGAPRARPGGRAGAPRRPEPTRARLPPLARDAEAPRDAGRWAPRSRSPRRNSSRSHAPRGRAAGTGLRQLRRLAGRPRSQPGALQARASRDPGPADARCRFSTASRTSCSCRSSGRDAHPLRLPARRGAGRSPTSATTCSGSRTRRSCASRARRCPCGSRRG